MKETLEVKPKIEKKEKELPKLNVIIVDDFIVGKALKQVINLRSDVQNVDIISSEKDLLKKTALGNVDIVIMSQSNREIIQAVTTIRNRQEIEHQPAIISIDDFFAKNKERQMLLNAGVDICIEQPIDVLKLFQGISSVPEFLGEIEDRYGDKVLRGKQGFYQEYHDKLYGRSEITADLEKELEMLEQVLEENKAKKVLDAGGGNGRIAIPLATKGYKVTNVDSSEELISEMNSEKSTVEGLVGDLKKLPVKDSSFDAITYNWHVFCDILGNKSKRKLLSEAFRVLKKNGTVVMDVPDRDTYKTMIDLVKENKEGPFNDPEKARKELAELKRYYREEQDSLARSILLQGINALAYYLDENLYYEPTPEQDEAGKFKHGQNKLEELRKVSFKKDGVYVDYPGGDAVFLGYVPSEEEIKSFLEEAGFHDIEIKRWKTKTGLWKVTFVAKK